MASGRKMRRISTSSIEGELYMSQEEGTDSPQVFHLTRMLYGMQQRLPAVEQSKVGPSRESSVFHSILHREDLIPKFDPEQIPALMNAPTSWTEWRIQLKESFRNDLHSSGAMPISTTKP